MVYVSLLPGVDLKPSLIKDPFVDSFENVLASVRTQQTPQRVVLGQQTLRYFFCVGARLRQFRKKAGPDID
jgi:hypothetical protein